MNQLLKAYLVDDECLERTLLRYSIPWKDYGVEIAGEAGSGKELLAMLQKEQPDILFTDICMPYMDGLALSRAVRERYRNTDSIILSGHGEFDYAKEAICIGVTEYLLKPVDREEVATTLKKIQ
ncbi:MAG: response regulator, partial [Oscillospiraceae bacterium]|nr:response regulator [Oscillospiraceae bacterium]